MSRRPKPHRTLAEAEAVARASIARGKRRDVVASVRQRFDALVASRAAEPVARGRMPLPARPDPLTEAAARARRLWPHRADIAREQERLRADLLVSVIDQHHEFEWEARDGTAEP